MRSALIMTVAALALTLGVPTRALATDLSAKIASAKTAADHEAIAAEYETTADDARRAAAEHDKMGQSYTGALKEKLQLDQHCRTIAARYRDQAKDLDALAAAHRAQAKAAGM